MNAKQINSYATTKARMNRTFSSRELRAMLTNPEVLPSRKQYAAEILADRNARTLRTRPFEAAFAKAERKGRKAAQDAYGVSE